LNYPLFLEKVKSKTGRALVWAGPGLTFIDFDEVEKQGMEKG
jgi:hypothetical protein